MATIIRRRAAEEDPPPRKIVRRSVEAPPAVRGEGWPLAMHPGYPHLEIKFTMHVIEIDKMLFTFMWNPHREAWTCGLSDYAPSIMARHIYHGECTIVYRRSSIPDPTQSYRRR